jgi:hypothetical protein
MLNIKNIVMTIIKEANSNRYAGSYNGPLTMGEIEWNKTETAPFSTKVSDFFNAELEYDSYDGTLDTGKKNIKKMESKARKISKYNKTHKTFSDEDGGIINATPGKNKNIVPIKEWVDLDKINLNEDLAVWFGTKKKGKGSKQPQGPWVNICRKKEGGGHPPCGRPEGESKGYPKCRAVNVARNMTAAQKRAACQQKRKAEKQDTQTGKGQKPIMVSYKPKKKKTQNESVDFLVKSILSIL